MATDYSTPPTLPSLLKFLPTSGTRVPSITRPRAGVGAGRLRTPGMRSRVDRILETGPSKLQRNRLGSSCLCLGLVCGCYNQISDCYNLHNNYLDPAPHFVRNFIYFCQLFLFLANTVDFGLLTNHCTSHVDCMNYPDLNDF